MERQQMSNASSGVTDLVSRGKGSNVSVKDRIERRLEVLRLWLKDGVPQGKPIPASLTAAREWRDEELGILPISSPNEFTKTRSPYRKQVADIAGLLTQLHSKYAKSVNKRTAGSSPSESKFDRNAFDRQLAAAAAQWHSERAARLQEKERADAAQARAIQLLEDNAKMESLVADLRRQLVVRGSLKVVE